MKRDILNSKNVMIMRNIKKTKYRQKPQLNADGECILGLTVGLV